MRRNEEFWLDTTFLNSRKRYIEILNIFRIFLSRFSKFKKNEEKRRAFWLDINFLNLRKKENFSNISSKFGKNEKNFSKFEKNILKFRKNENDF